MKTLALTKATGPLADYARQVDDGPVILTVRGRPVAALVPVNGVDLEALALSTNPDFLDLIEASRRRQRDEGGIPEAQVRRRLGLPSAPRQRRRAARKQTRR
jgi:prevent-host-death family protein